MGNQSKVRSLHLKQLDERVKQIGNVVPISTPKDGWVRQIRVALGISARQLASRLGTSQPNLAQIEKGEVERTVSIQTLDKIAEALDCKVIYAFVPKHSFESLVRERATHVAAKMGKRVSHSMDLEKQGLSAKKREEQTRETANELAASLNKQLWEDWK